MEKYKTGQHPNSLANLQPQPRQPQREKTKTARWEVKLTPADKKAAKDLLTDAGWQSLAEFWEAVVDGKTQLPEKL